VGLFVGEGLFVLERLFCWGGVILGVILLATGYFVGEELFFLCRSYFVLEALFFWRVVILWGTGYFVGEWLFCWRPAILSGSGFFVWEGLFCLGCVILLSVVIFLGEVILLGMCYCVGGGVILLGRCYFVEERLFFQEVLFFWGALSNDYLGDGLSFGYSLSCGEGSFVGDDHTLHIPFPSPSLSRPLPPPHTRYTRAHS